MDSEAACSAVSEHVPCSSLLDQRSSCSAGLLQGTVFPAQLLTRLVLVRESDSIGLTALIVCNFS